MTACVSSSRMFAFAVTVAGLLALGLVLSGCAGVSSEDMMVAFGDPAKYDLYDCKQLEAERKNLATREAELQGLMAKAQTGTAGPVVAELAYRNDYLKLRGQAHFAEEAWRNNKCHPSPPGAATASAPATPPAKPARPSRSGGAVN